jgi:hypothetical protein
MSRMGRVAAPFDTHAALRIEHPRGLPKNPDAMWPASVLFDAAEIFEIRCPQTVDS